MCIALYRTRCVAPRVEALECVAALARTRECRQDCVRFAYCGAQVDRLHVLELKRDVENDVRSDRLTLS
jgi:hypothetical protein